MPSKMSFLNRDGQLFQNKEDKPIFQELVIFKEEDLRFLGFESLLPVQLSTPIKEVFIVRLIIITDYG